MANGKFSRKPETRREEKQTENTQGSNTWVHIQTTFPPKHVPKSKHI